MTQDIKNFKPNKKSQFYQGYFENAKKYQHKDINNPEPIIYRSGWEKQFMISLEMNPQVKSWSSEAIMIPYFLVEKKGDKLIKTRHNYFPDFFIELHTGKKILIEVKPRCQCPKIQKDIDRNPTMRKNACKWKAAIEFCKLNGFEFKLITEDSLSLKNF